MGGGGGEEGCTVTGKQPIRVKYMFNAVVNLVRSSSMLSAASSSAGAIQVLELTGKGRGRSLLLGEELDRQVQSYLISKWSCREYIAMGCAEGIVKSADSNILTRLACIISLDNGKRWSRNLCNR